ncbi:MAG: exodeoxyribonuclease VII large subunit, partial [Erysipelotrichaceae bacterium]|nr:exodeoxyribonuclease VII large subunit [Erysipelotrichaceae bacterium]
MTNTIWSITQLVGYVKNKLTFDSNLRNVKVQGELGNFSSYRGSGHWYFTLKDAGASIKCAMFKGYNNAVEFNPEEGDTVIVTGTVNVYENRGELQLVVTEMKLAGQGMFYIQFEKTRQKLEPLGYFDESRK